MKCHIGYHLLSLLPKYEQSTFFCKFGIRKHKTRIMVCTIRILVFRKLTIDASWLQHSCSYPFYLDNAFIKCIRRESIFHQEPYWHLKQNTLIPSRFFINLGVYSLHNEDLIINLSSFKQFSTLMCK